MARIIRSGRSQPRRAHVAAGGLACAALLALLDWRATPPGHPPAQGAAAREASVIANGDRPGGDLAAGPGRPEPAQPEPMAIALERIERAPSGRVAAVLRVDGGPARRHLQGDSLGTGVRLARIGVDGIEVESHGTSRSFRLPPGVQPLRAGLPEPAGRPVLLTLPGPPSPAVAQVLQSPSSAGVVEASPDRANPAHSGIDRWVAAEALRLSTQ